LLLGAYNFPSWCINQSSAYEEEEETEAGPPS
jgi:hypothetical protein